MSEETNRQPSRLVLLVVTWLWVGLPLAYGVVQLLVKASQLFVR